MTPSGGFSVSSKAEKQKRKMTPAELHRIKKNIRTSLKPNRLAAKLSQLSGCNKSYSCRAAPEPSDIIKTQE